MSRFFRKDFQAVQGVSVRQGWNHATEFYPLEHVQRCAQCYMAENYYSEKKVVNGDALVFFQGHCGIYDKSIRLWIMITELLRWTGYSLN